MPAFSYACSLPVTWQRWQLHHSIRCTWKPMLHANITALCLTERELLPIEVLHCGYKNFWRFWLLWPWPWPNDLHTWTRPMVHGAILHVQIWTSYIKAFESYRLTDIVHTYRHDQSYIPCHFAGWSIMWLGSSIFKSWLVHVYIPSNSLIHQEVTAAQCINVRHKQHAAARPCTGSVSTKESGW